MLVLGNPCKLWLAANLEQRQRIRRLFLPGGFVWADGKIRAAVTPPVLMALRQAAPAEDGMVPRAGFKPATSGSGGQRSIR